MLSQTPNVTAARCGESKCERQRLASLGLGSQAASPQPQILAASVGRRFQGISPSPSIPSSGGVGPEMAEKPGLCTETRPQAQPQLTFLLHLTSSSHFLLSHSFSNSLGAPPQCVWGGHPFLSEALPAYPSVPGPSAPPSTLWAGVGSCAGCDGARVARGRETRRPLVLRRLACKTLNSVSQ